MDEYKVSSNETQSVDSVTLDENTFLKDCWSFYLTLEERFIDTLRYVALAEENGTCYSAEYQNLLLNVGSEFETQLKSYLGIDKGNVLQWQKKVIDEQNFSECNVVNVVYPSKISFIAPLYNWTTDSEAKLEWWKDYNSLKHNRLQNFEKGNQKNVLYGLAALYLILRYQYHRIKGFSVNIIPASKLFSISWGSDYTVISNAEELSRMLS